MTMYGNQAGNSGVLSYETGPDSITVRFVFGGTYVYSVASAGPANVQRMKELAAAGRGLSTFISTEVKERYASKR